MILVADNIQITNRDIEKALEELDPKPIQDLVQRCVAAGADVIDINTGPLTRDGEVKMAFLVEAVQDVTDLPLSIDTTNPRAMEAGLRSCKAKTLINGFSLEPTKVERILPLAQTFDCDVIGFLLYPDGRVPRDAAERLELALALFETYKKARLDPDKLILDPVLVPILWQDGPSQAREIVKVVRMLPELLGYPVRTIIGLSNLTSGRGPKMKKVLLEGAYVGMLAGAGLSMALVNVFHGPTVSLVRACRSLVVSDIFTWEEIP